MKGDYYYTYSLVEAAILLAGDYLIGDYFNDEQDDAFTLEVGGGVVLNISVQGLSEAAGIGSITEFENIINQNLTLIS